MKKLSTKEVSLIAFISVIVALTISDIAVSCTRSASAEESTNTLCAIIKGGTANTITEYNRLEQERIEYERLSCLIQSFKYNGIIYDDTYSYTWYSEKRLPGGGLYALNNNGRHADDHGLIRDSENYIAVSSDVHSQGDTLSTPFGMAKVYDCGSGAGNIDVYVNW